MNNYRDIMGAEHPVSSRHPAMDIGDRAAQFAPFAALTGYDAVIAETARLTDDGIELEEEGKAMVNAALVRLQAKISETPKAVITYFCPDERKAGGAYKRTEGRVKKIDLYEGRLVLTDGTRIPLEHIYQIDDADQEELL